MSFIEIKDLTYSYDKNKILKGINLTINKGDFFFLLGPSGCGKTTLLRAIAGLGEPPDSGEIIIDGINIKNIPPWKRNVPMVFQNYALWPHMTVFDNVAFGLKQQKESKENIKKKVLKMLEVIGLADKAQSKPSQLSGGQQQRVALARSLVLSPEVILLDEPLSNLDAKLRQEMRYELKSIHRKLGITFIYVTHDQEEALSMATKIALLNKGKVIQAGTPTELYFKPNSAFSASFMGEINSIKGVITQNEQKSWALEGSHGLFENFQLEKKVQNSKVKLFFRPEHINISLKKLNSSNINGVLEEINFLGSKQEYFIKCNNITIKCIDSSFNGKLEKGKTVYLSIPSENILVFHPKLKKQNE